MNWLALKYTRTHTHMNFEVENNKVQNQWSKFLWSIYILLSSIFRHWRQTRTRLMGVCFPHFPINSHLDDSFTLHVIYWLTVMCLESQIFSFIHFIWVQRCLASKMKRVRKQIIIFISRISRIFQYLNDAFNFDSVYTVEIFISTWWWYNISLTSVTNVLFLIHTLSHCFDYYYSFRLLYLSLDFAINQLNDFLFTITITTHTR